MSNRTLTRSRLSLLVAAALFGASGMAFGQSSDPAEIPVDDLSVQADLDEDGLDDNDGNPDVEDDSSALADAQDPEDDDIDVDGDFDPEVDPDIDAHGGATGDADPMAMDEPAPLPDPIAVDAEDVDGAVVATDPVTAPVDPGDEAAMDAMGFESDSEVAASGDTGMEAADAGSGGQDGPESGAPEDAFAATAGTEGFSEGATAASAEQRFQELDSDSSGSLSEEEVASVQPLQSAFDEYDLNDDGSIAENEFQSFFAATAEVESEVQTAQVGDGTLDASDRAMEQDATAASTEPETDTAVASESTGPTGEDGMDATTSSEATAATDDDGMATDATAATDTDTDTSTEATAATERSMDYDSYQQSSTLANEPEEEDLTVQSDEDEGDQ